MDIGKSLGYAFEDEDWLTKLLIGGLVTLIPVVNLAAAGYALRVLRNVADGDERPLPEWNAFGEHFTKGLLLAVALLIYATPLLLVGATALVVSVLGVNASRTGSGALTVCGLGLWSLVACYGVLLSLWFPAVTAVFALSGEFAAFFRFGEARSFAARNLGGYIVALFVTVLAGAATWLAGMVLFLIGSAFSVFWAMLLGAHLLGQLQREGREAIAATTG